MKVSIIPEDRVVVVNNFSLTLDTLPMSIPEDVHALQWDETSGWVELKNVTSEQIVELPSWAGDCIAAHAIMAASADSDATAEIAPEDTIRHLRNNLLRASDWTQLADAPIDTTAWSAYRQALRDVPAQAGFPDSVTWPAKP